MAVAAGKVRGPLAGPGGQAARPGIRLAVYCIPAHPEELHPDTTKPNSFIELWENLLILICILFFKPRVN